MDRSIIDVQFDIRPIDGKTILEQAADIMAGNAADLRSHSSYDPRARVSYVAVLRELPDGSARLHINMTRKRWYHRYTWHDAVVLLVFMFVWYADAYLGWLDFDASSFILGSAFAWFMSSRWIKSQRRKHT